MLSDKTGVLIATAARYGAMFSGATPETVDLLRRYGEQLGVAFQLADDLIDIASESGQSGKTPGTDLREGVPTLPVLLALRSRDPADARLHELLRADLRHDDALHAEALQLLRDHAAMRQAREHDPRRWAPRRAELLAPLPAGPAKEALLALVEGVVERVG